MADYRVNLRSSPKLIESAAEFQLANRERLEAKELKKRVKKKVETGVKEKLTVNPSLKSKKEEGERLERIKSKFYKVRTNPFCICGGFLFIPNTYETYSFVSQQWINGKNNTVITADSNGRLVKMSIFEGDFEACSYLILGDIRTPEDDTYPGAWDKNQSYYYDELGNMAPGFNFNTNKMVNSNTYWTDKVLAKKANGAGSGWPNYVEDMFGLKNFGFFYHLATKTGPPAKHDQKMLDKYGLLVPKRYMRNPSMEDDNKTIIDESIKAFEKDVYSTCTFEVIISLGSAPLPILGTIKTIAGNPLEDQNKLIMSVEYDAYTLTNSVHSSQVTGPNGPPWHSSSWSVSPIFVENTSTNPATKIEYATFEDTPGMLENCEGQLAFVLGGINFSAETLSGNDPPQSMWKIYFWNENLTIDDNKIVAPLSEYHIAVVYQQYKNLNPNNGEPSTFQTCEVFIEGKRVASVSQQEVSSDLLMATAFAGISQKKSYTTNTNPDSTDLVVRSVQFSLGNVTGEVFPAQNCYYLPASSGNSCYIPGSQEEQYAWSFASSPFYGKIYSTPPAVENNTIISGEIVNDTIIGKYPFTVFKCEPSSECQVGFHSLRFTPEQALYTENFTPPKHITELA